MDYKTHQIAMINKLLLAQKIRELQGLSLDEKSQLLGLINDHKRYGLVWEDKVEEVEEQLQDQLPILTEVTNKRILSDNVDAPNHLLIEGDNLHALTCLSYTHEGKIDVIYIDPPYNTGNKDFVYNDKYVDADDDFRHSKWLSFMSKRLRIARRLLAEHGTIFISIDDHEQAALKLLCDDIFGEKNFQGHIHWRRRHNQPNDKNKLIALVAEHILVYSKNGQVLKEFGVGKVGLTGSFSNPDNDPNGDWTSNPWKAANGRGGTYYSLETPTGKVLTETWYGTLETFELYKAQGRVHWTNKGNGIPRIKIYRKDAEESGQCANNWWVHSEFGCNQDATDEMKLIFDGVCPFDNPKPTKLLKIIVKLGCIKKNAVILDFFAGSGSTMHAVMQLNNEDGGNRQCILVTNNENGICENITYERNRRVIIATSNENNNSLRYYQTNYVPRERTQRNMRALVNAATDLLCIQNNLYDEQDFLINGKKVSKSIARYFGEMLVVYREEFADEIARAIEGMEIKGKKLKVYIFSPGRYAFDDTFIDVQDKVELVALPAAIYDAYKHVLPKRREKLFEEPQSSIPTDLFSEL